MRPRWKRRFVSFIFAVGFLALAHTAPAQQESSCVDCHRQLEDERISPPAEDWLQSVHKEAGVSCHACHGGDPTIPDITAMATDDYIGVPSVTQIPELCASCHSDPDRMRKYNLRVDEYQLFRRSGHGRALYERGDTKVATCVSCHGAHKVLKKEHIDSPVHYTNIAQTCGECHSDPAYMEGYGLPTNQVDEYNESYHAMILRGEIEGKNPALAPTCASCHTHSPLLPEAVEVPEICGRCHAVTASYYKDGPHYQSLMEVGTPRCVDCHGNHDIEYPTLEMFSGVEEGHCGSCHDADSAAYQLGQRIRGQLETATEKVQIMETELAEIEHSGRNLSDLQTLTEQAQTSLTEVLPITHTLSFERIAQRTTFVVEKADTLFAEVDQFKAELRARKRNLAVILAVILLNIAFLYIKRRSLEKG
ncbi:MAG: hypothetical protein Kow0099_28490 [Candidatus Abyssubacteria bacterium]